MTKTLIVAELDECKVRKATLSSITFARQVGIDYSVLVIGPDASRAAEDLTGFGAKQIFAANICGNYICERYAPTVAHVAQGFDVIVATATAFGKDLIPRVAAKLCAGYAADIAAVVLDESGALVFKRPMYAGNVYGYASVTTAVKAVTVRQSEFACASPSGGSSPIEPVEVQPPSAGADRVEFLHFDSSKTERPELTEASVIVAGGRACKDKFFEILGPLADRLGAAIGATRAACDAGYAPGDSQVGQTGKIVAPDLYFAFGISGAIQHVAGIKGSKVIVAVNKDPEAPIFSVADYGLVGDLFQVIPELLKRIDGTC